MTEDLTLMDRYLTATQREQLLKPLNPSRVERLEKSGMTLSYLSQADVRAHLTRIFGFGRFDAQVVDTALLFEEKVEGHDKRERWYVGWQATVLLRVRTPSGDELCTHVESAVGGNTQPQRHEASDMALKSATSDALKRCCINLGDQFGLGLYDKGSTGAIVRGVLWPPGPDEKLPEPEPVDPDKHNDKLKHSLGHEGSVSDYQ